MTVDALCPSSPPTFASAPTDDHDLDTKSLDGHFRADLHPSARPYYERLIALAGLWVTTPTGRKVLAEASDLDATGNRIKFQAGGMPSSPEPGQPAPTVRLGTHLLETGAREIGVSPDVDHACEVMKDVVRALNVLAARGNPADAEHRNEHMNPEKLASEFRKELQERNGPSGNAPPARPPLPDPVLVEQTKPAATTAVPGNKTETLMSVTSAQTPPDDPVGEHPYQATVVAPRAQAGRGRRFVLWMRRRVTNAIDGVRMIFRRRQAPIGERGATADASSSALNERSLISRERGASANEGSAAAKERSADGKERSGTVVEMPSRRPSTSSLTPIRRNSDPAHAGSAEALLKRGSNEIHASFMGGQEGAESSLEADRNVIVTETEIFTPKHRRKKSGTWKWLRAALPGGGSRQQKSHQPVPGTRDNSLSGTNTRVGSISESAGKRPSISASPENRPSISTSAAKRPSSSESAAKRPSISASEGKRPSIDAPVRPEIPASNIPASNAGINE